jgi:hypothetical protein
MGNLVTIDHYVRDSKDMGEYIDFFTRTFNSKVAIGEFGGPIPDLNGEMTEEQQAMFVTHVLSEMYSRKDSLVGVNYWTLTHSSSSLLNPDYSERKVANVLRDYYIPGVLVGRVVNESGEGVREAYVKIDDRATAQYSDSDGFFVVKLPAGSYTVSASDLFRQSQEKTVIIERKKQITVTLVIK